MYDVLNTLSEYTYFYVSKNITSNTFLLVFKIVESLQCILNIQRINTLFKNKTYCYNKTYQLIFAPVFKIIKETVLFYCEENVH